MDLIATIGRQRLRQSLSGGSLKENPGRPLSETVYSRPV